MDIENNVMETQDVEPTTIDYTSKTSDYEKNMAKGAVAAQNAIVGAMFEEGGMGELLNRDGKADMVKDVY